MKAKFTFFFLYLFIFPSINSMSIGLLTRSNAAVAYPLLSYSSEGVSNYIISQSVTYQVEINFTFTHISAIPQIYYFKVARLNDRQPNSTLTQYCPPYQESQLLLNTITGYDVIEKGFIDKFNNTYDLFNSTLNKFDTITLSQNYNITLNEISFKDIQDEDIGTYNPGDEIHALYNVTEKFYNCSNY